MEPQREGNYYHPAQQPIFSPVGLPMHPHIFNAYAAAAASGQAMTSAHLPQQLVANGIPSYPLYGALDGTVRLSEQLSPGLHYLYLKCREIYPEQPNPLQVTAVKKCWLGGQDPLDYISMYANPGNAEQNIPPHWHYISFGLSDLYGDGRIYGRTGKDICSGFGFELTFRLKREPNESGPPTWPATVMQELAKYVFQREEPFYPGDPVTWKKSLDCSESLIHHMLMTEDPKLGTVVGPFGQVTFVQIVGVMRDELQAAQQWNGPGVIDLMKTVPNAGGPLLVTDMRRNQSIFELDQEVKEAVEDGINVEGSMLGGVSAACTYIPKILLQNLPNLKTDTETEDDQIEGENETEESEDRENNSEKEKKELDNTLQSSNQMSAPTSKDQIKNEDDKEIRDLNEAINHIKIADPEKTSSVKDQSSSSMPVKAETTFSQEMQTQDKEQNAKNGRLRTPSISRGRSLISLCKSGNSSSMSTSHDQLIEEQNLSRMSYTSETGATEPDLSRPHHFKQLHITLNAEAGMLIPLALRGRLKHNFHFTFKSSNLAITFLTPSADSPCVFVNKDKPYGIHGSWLQIMLTPEFIDEILCEFEDINQLLHPDYLPRSFLWSRKKLALTIWPEDTPENTAASTACDSN